MRRDTFEVIHSDGSFADTYESPSRESAVQEFRRAMGDELIGKDEEITVFAYHAGDSDSERVPFLVSQDYVEKLE